MLLAACAREETGEVSGYVEAELLYIAPQDAGVLRSLLVSEGDSVEKGARLFEIDPERMRLSLEQAERVAGAAAARVGEKGALAEAVAEAEAQFENARGNYDRSRMLRRQGVVTEARVDNDRAAFDGAAARLQRLRAERDAAAGDAAAQAALAELWKKRLADLSVAAPSGGTIERIYRRPGEMVAVGDPVLALLPPGHVKIRFYAPEPRLSALTVGARVEVSCDRCASDLRARITYVASEPQFTPPVIYSVEERAKLVFLIEARPEDAAKLTPGLPVTVRLP
jgi:HlyD family secretion protein